LSSELFTFQESFPSWGTACTRVASASAALGQREEAPLPLDLELELENDGADDELGIGQPTTNNTVPHRYL